MASLASLSQTRLRATTTSESWHFDAVSRGGRIAVRLRGRGQRTLGLITGIESRYVHPHDRCRDDRILTIEASAHQMAVTLSQRTLVVWPQTGCDHLVTAWTLPFLGIGGFLGFHGADIDEIGRSNASFFDLPLDASRLPALLGSSRTTAVYAVFFGEAPSLQAMNAALGRVWEAVESHVDVVAAAAMVDTHEPRLLLTVFNDGLGLAAPVPAR